MNPPPFLILLTGYTAVGKSTLGKLLSSKLKAEIFHSADIRSSLNLVPSKNQSESIFDFRNNTRFEMDNKVYGKIAELAKNELDSKKPAAEPN